MLLTLQLRNTLLATVGAVVAKMGYRDFFPDEKQAIVHQTATPLLLVEKFFVYGLVASGGWGGWDVNAECLVVERDPDQIKVMIIIHISRNHGPPPCWECLVDSNYQVTAIREVEPPVKQSTPAPGDALRFGG